MKLGVIGYGNLGKALVQGLVNSGVSQKDILINARSQKTLEGAKTDFEKIHTTQSKEELVKISDVIIIVVEPKHAHEVMREVGSSEVDGKIIVSLMAGITIRELKDMLGVAGNHVKLVRVMPNVAIANCKGVLGFAYDEVDCDEIKAIVGIFEKLGYMIKVGENSLENITVTAASGIAFAASLMSAYQSASSKLFKDDVMSKEITYRVFENVIDIIKKEGCSFDEIIERIVTKGGTTEAGMNALDREMIVKNMTDCVMQAHNKANNIDD